MPTTPQASEVKAEGGHTPGPWVIIGDGDIGELAICPAMRSGEIAVIMFDDRDETTPKAKRKLADACLIAAAPDLLDALKIARECIAYCRRAHPDVQSGHGFPVEVILDVAIAKATGSAT